MKLLIAPAKKMREEDALEARTRPALLEKTAQLLEYLRGLSLPELRRLLACNESLAREAYGRFQGMELERGASPALLAYDGIQYKYMAPGVFTQGQLDYAQEHVRILSGFYGVLRPFDGVCPYRLEMQAKVRTPFCRDLYGFWGEDLARQLLAEDQVFVNLASEEYARAVRPGLRDRARFITCVFAEEEASGRLVEKGVYVKMARGEMVRFAAENGLTSPEGLREFRGLGYVFRPGLSDGERYVFCRGKEESRKKI